MAAIGDPGSVHLMIDGSILVFVEDPVQSCEEEKTVLGVVVYPSRVQCLIHRCGTVKFLSTIGRLQINVSIPPYRR
jgi:hypothetical protein